MCTGISTISSRTTLKSEDNGKSRFDVTFVYLITNKFLIFLKIVHVSKKNRNVFR